MFPEQQRLTFFSHAGTNLDNLLVDVPCAAIRHEVLLSELQWIEAQLCCHVIHYVLHKGDAFHCA